ncbi:MAG: asparagine synthetase B family protein, partial [Tumebacillaceae bacterium]
MTGIAGFLDWKGTNLERTRTLDAMTSVLTHRRLGSDDTVEFVDAQVSLTTGLLWSEHDVTVAVEGYLYNRDELRKELSSAGHAFNSAGLAEVLQKAYLHWGDSFVERLYGAFAFALWDAREQRLLVGRDQIGIKPIYVAECAGTVVFGSETKAVLEHPLVTRDVDAAGLTELLVKGPCFSPGQAVFRDVQELLPGHMMIFTPNGRKDTRYWDVESYEHEDSVDTTIDKLRAMLESNMAQLAEQNLSSSAILSGGLDSSGLIAMMCQASGNDLITYSGNTPESLAQVALEELDTPWVRRVAEYLGITNEEIMVEASAIFESLHQPRRALDLPLNAKYDTLFFVVLKRIAEQQHRSVVIGDAPDELFGSLKWFYDQSAWDDSPFPWIN